MKWPWTGVCQRLYWDFAGTSYGAYFSSPIEWLWSGLGRESARGPTGTLWGLHTGPTRVAEERRGEERRGEERRGEERRGEERRGEERRGEERRGEERRGEERRGEERRGEERRGEERRKEERRGEERRGEERGEERRGEERRGEERRGEERRGEERRGEERRGEERRAERGARQPRGVPVDFGDVRRTLKPPTDKGLQRDGLHHIPCSWAQRPIVRRGPIPPGRAVCPTGGSKELLAKSFWYFIRGQLGLPYRMAMKWPGTGVCQRL